MDHAQLNRLLKAIEGFAEHFCPTYAEANEGHPSFSIEFAKA
jgi:hypothetical protein